MNVGPRRDLSNLSVSSKTMVSLVHLLRANAGPVYSLYNKIITYRESCPEGTLPQESNLDPMFFANLLELMRQRAAEHRLREVTSKSSQRVSIFPKILFLKGSSFLLITKCWIPFAWYK